jgi:hypothetical protein
MTSGEQLDRLLREFPPVSLAEVDARAELLRRTDTKYVLDPDRFAALLSELAGDHEVLEIDRRRRFAYESVYFDSEDLRCFSDHVRGCAPRFKARTRLYVDTGQCNFEVKLKREDGETEKRQVDHSPQAAGEMDGEAERCLMEALRDARIDPPPRPLEASLRTCFNRITLVPREGHERTTCDLHLCLVRPDGSSARIREGMVVVETKSEHGGGPVDQRLERMGAETVSFSKYRTGIALLGEGIRDPDYQEHAERLFAVDEG